MQTASMKGAQHRPWVGCSRAKPRTQLRVSAYAGRDDAKWRQLPAVGPEQANRGYWIDLLSRSLSEFSDATLDANEFTPSTFAAVLEFQHRNGLECSGVVTPSTWAALLSHNEVLRSEALDPISWHGPYQQYVHKENGRVMYETPWDTLHEMTIGATSLYWVGRLQSMLTTAGFQLEEQELANCCLGPSTWAAVLSYQDQTPGLEPTGVLDSLTWASLSAHVSSRMPMGPVSSSHSSMEEAAAAGAPADEHSSSSSSSVAVLTTPPSTSDAAAGSHKLPASQGNDSEHDLMLVPPAVVPTEAGQGSVGTPARATPGSGSVVSSTKQASRPDISADRTPVSVADSTYKGNRVLQTSSTRQGSSSDDKGSVHMAEGDDAQSLTEQALRDLMDLEAEMHALRMEREQLRLHALLVKQQERARDGGQALPDSQDAIGVADLGAAGQSRGGKSVRSATPEHHQANSHVDTTQGPALPRPKQAGDRLLRGRSYRSRRVTRRLGASLAARQQQLEVQDTVHQQEASLDEGEAGHMLSQHQDLVAFEYAPLQDLPPIWEVTFPVMSLHQDQQSPVWTDLLHVALQRQGFFHPELKFEGSYFGMGSHAAVLAFQASAGLPATGVVDGPTWAALLRHEPQLQSIAYAALATL